jgi:hypothetical protein
MDIDAFHLPAGPAATAVIAERDDVRAYAPVLSVEQLAGTCDALRAAQARLHDVPVDRVIAAVDAAASVLLDTAAPARAIALRALTAFSGYSPQMAEVVLDRAARDWLAPALHALVHTELGGAAAVESFITRPAVAATGTVRCRAVAPALGLHVFSGNVAGIGITSVVRALLVRSAVLGKTAAGEPVLTALFAQLLAAADPLVGACVAVTYWRGGDVGLETVALQHADMVVHYGAAASIASLRERAGPHTRFIEHGPRISFALIDAAAGRAGAVSAGPPGAVPGPVMAGGAARELATAVALFDQQGCVSPQLAYVIGPPERARAFAEAVAAELERLQHELPRGRLEPVEAAAIRALRARAEFAAIGSSGLELWGGTALEWSVLYTDDVAFEGSCLNRTLLVKPASSVEAVVAAARPYGSILQTVGIAGFDGSRLERAAAQLAAIGVTRVTTLAGMPWPPPAWHHDGRGPLTELVRWVDLEG